MTKSEWRTVLLARRRARDAAERTRARQRISDHLLTALTTGTGTAPGPPPTVCAYLPLPSEPLAPDLPARLAAAGWRVLVPVTRPKAPLDWCELPATGPRLGPQAIREAQVIVLPALAVDATGTRLGRGQGHYDRSLALLRQDAPAPGVTARLIAVLFDDEFVPHLPSDAHDVPATDVVTPNGGLRPLPRRVASA